MANAQARKRVPLSSRSCSYRFLQMSLRAAPLLLSAIMLPQAADACACGCGIFDLGAGVFSAMPQSDSGLTIWFRYDYMSQNRNWQHDSIAPAANNADKKIDTSFYTVGAEYMVDPDWIVMAELPVYDRTLTTTDDGTVFGPPGSLYTAHLTDLGDAQLSATYSGLSPDQSTGLTFGVKLPTGNDSGPTGPLGGKEFDRDTLPGTGSSDFMLGGYHTGGLTADETLSYFVQGKFQFAVLTQGGYRPGNELDGAAGLSYNWGGQGPFDNVTPVLQLIGSWRASDSGVHSDPLNSGYRRLMIAPGIAAQVKKFRLFADIELPVYQYVNAAPSVAIEGTAGQLVAPVLYKLQLAYDF